VVESRIPRPADFGVARKLLFLLHLRSQLSGSNSVGRMPASHPGSLSVFYRRNQPLFIISASSLRPHSLRRARPTSGILRHLLEQSGRIGCADLRLYPRQRRAGRSGAALLWRLHGDKSPARREEAERLTSRIVGTCFLLLSAYIAKFRWLRSAVGKPQPEACQES
jgi:hypothetical protein